MTRAPRRRLQLFALLIATPMLMMAPWAFAADADVPTIIFSATGTPPAACGTQPNLSSMSIKMGTKIIVANVTGVAASLYVGAKKIIDLDPGKGARMRLKRGQHELRMVPTCPSVSGTVTAVVNVLTGVELGNRASTSPPPRVGASVRAGAGDGGDPDDPIETPVAVAVSPGQSASAGPVGGAGATSSAGVVLGGTMSEPPVLQERGEVDGEVYEVDAINFADRTDPKGLTLLGVIATICALGVTAAIIRAIVAERTTSTVRP